MNFSVFESPISSSLILTRSPIWFAYKTAKVFGYAWTSKNLPQCGTAESNEILRAELRIDAHRHIKANCAIEKYMVC